MWMQDLSINQRKILVDGEECIVTCSQTRKTVWVAVGECNGKFIQEKGSSRNVAFANWKRVASFMNN
jgi:hypothetical protein